MAVINLSISESSVGQDLPQNRQPVEVDVIEEGTDLEYANLEHVHDYEILVEYSNQQETVGRTLAYNRSIADVSAGVELPWFQSPIVRNLFAASRGTETFTIDVVQNYENVNESSTSNEQVEIVVTFVRAISESSTGREDAFMFGARVI